MVLESLAVLSGVKGVFMYNRQAFQFNKTLDQERLYHLQKMRIRQVELYREDMEDLYELVRSKMDNYYLVNTIALVFALGLYYEGRVPADCPSWLFWMWAMALGAAIVYLFLSVWFAVHASVVAQMFSTRILTQWLRLPIPGIDQIDAAAPKLEEFEKAPAKQVLRVPVLSGSRTQTGVVVGDTEATTDNSTPPNGQQISASRSVPQSARKLVDPPVTRDPFLQKGYSIYMGHFYLFSRLQKHWMSLDAYCRVCMVVGCNQILNVVTYTALAYFALYDNQWGYVLI
jgi:hypothetical protein